MKPKIWKLTAVGLASVLLWDLTAAVAADSGQGAKIALKNLMTSEMSIEKLPDDQAGHRAQALVHARAAAKEMREYLRAAAQ